MGVRLHKVGMVVNDMGLAIPHGQDDEPHVEFTSDGYTLGFDPEDLVRRTDPAWRQPEGQRLNLQFEIGAPAQVDAAFAALTGAGAAVDPDVAVINLFAEL